MTSKTDDVVGSGNSKGEGSSKAGCQTRPMTRVVSLRVIPSEELAPDEVNR